MFQGHLRGEPSRQPRPGSLAAPAWLWRVFVLIRVVGHPRIADAIAADAADRRLTLVERGERAVGRPAGHLGALAPGVVRRRRGRRRAQQNDRRRDDEFPHISNPSIHRRKRSDIAIRSRLLMHARAIGAMRIALGLHDSRRRLPPSLFALRRTRAPHHEALPACVSPSPSQKKSPH